MKPFNLEEALAGAPVVNHDGEKLWLLKHPVADNYIICSEVGGADPISSTGLRLAVTGMWEEPAPEIPDIIWEVLPKEVQWVAMEDSGEWYGYEVAPRKGLGWWEGGGDYLGLEAVEHLLPDVEWYKSLTQRPEGK